MQFSSFNRQAFIEKAITTQFDLIIIGGGITGAGIALDAAARGMQVLLLEKYDFASGTSSKSTKLIHGGLRYLKQFEFSLVRQIGMERATIHKLAPHLVIPINMLLPIYRNGTLGKFSTSLALRVYDFLAKVRKQDAYKMLGKLQIQTFEPLLKVDGLMAGAMYKEYQTDDARLTLSILKKAVEYGATCINYAKCNQFIYQHKKIIGVHFTDLIENNNWDAKGDVVINASGPWVDEVRKLDAPIHGKKLHLTKGIHIVISRKLLPIKEAIYFDVLKDHRMIFIIPRDQKVYIGTTDTNYFGAKEQIEITKEDVDYLLDAVNEMFPKSKLKMSDIESSWAGLRPLIHEENKKPGELSRKDEIFVSENGLISIAGGKLTGYRIMAEKAVNLVAKYLFKSKQKYFDSCKTDRIILSGADFQLPISSFTEKRIGEAKQIQVSASKIASLVSIFGTDAEKIIEIAFELSQKIEDPNTRVLYAEIKYCVEHEMVTNLSDFLIRRTGKLYFDKATALSELKLTSELLEEILNLTHEEIEIQIEFFMEQVKNSNLFI